MAGRWKMASAVLLLAPLAACGGGDGSSASGYVKSSALQIESPKEGARVSAPITVKLSSPVPLGRPGRQHYVRVTLNGLSKSIVTNETFRITNREIPPGPGPLAIDVALYNADGEWVGSSAEVEVSVAGKG